MATKGVPLDLNKKYKMQNGTKIIRLVLTNKNPYSFGYPIFTYYINKNGIECCSIYTFDGFYWENRRDDKRNLILDEKENAIT